MPNCGTRDLLAMLCAVTVVVVSNACSPVAPTEESSRATQASEPTFTNWPTLLNDFRFRWSSAPQIDVATGPGMIARAYMESYDTAWFTLNIDNVYPGFLDATPENQRTDGLAPAQLTNVRPLGPGITKSAVDARPHYGYQVLHLLDLQQIAGGFRATVCSGEYAHFVESRSQPGKFIAIGSDDETGEPLRPNDTGVFVYRVDLKENGGRIGRKPSAPITTPQVGPAPAPANDVFGNWFVTGASSSGWGPATGPEAEVFPNTELQQRCEAGMPMNAQQRRSMMTGLEDQPPPAGEAVPGWPD